MDAADAVALDEAREARASRIGRVAVSLTVLAFALHLGSIVARGVSAGRPPWGNMFEFSTTGALAVTGVFLLLLTRKDVRYLGTFVILPVLLTLGLAVAVFYTESAQLVPALKSVWLVIHVTAAIIASGILTIGFTQSICYLVQEKRERVPRRVASAVVHGPAARGRGARPVGVQDARLRLPDLDLRRHRRRDLGRERLGPVLGLGPEGDLGVHHLDGLHGLPARAGHGGLEGPEGGLPGLPRATRRSCSTTWS